MRHTLRILLLAAMAGTPGCAFAQGGVLQSGEIVPGHVAVWLRNGTIRDGGTTGATTPGGSNGQVQYNNAGAFGAFTMGGDCTLTAATGAIVCRKTNGASFGAAATLGVGAGLASSGGNVVLANPAAGALGGTRSYAAVSNQFLTSISTSGQPVSAQPAFSNLSGAATLAQFPAMATLTVLGNVTGGAAVPTALSRAQLTALLNPFSSSLSGSAPASGGGTTNFLRADGTWASPLSGTLLVDAITGNDAALTIVGQTGGTAGSVGIAGGLSTSASAGGAVTMTGGTNAVGGNGGATTIVGGLAVGAGNGGAVTITTGTAGTSGSAGTLTVSVGSAAGASGSNITITAGDGNGGTNAGGSVNLTGGAAVSTGSPGEVRINGNGSLAFATYFFTGSPAATDQVFFVAPRPMRVKAISCVFSAAAGGTSTLTVTKDSSTAVPGTGVSLYQSGNCNLNSTINTPQVASVATTVATTEMATGDRLAVKYANTIQSSAGIVVTVGMQPF